VGRLLLIKPESLFKGGCAVVERNPVRAGLSEAPGEYPWSSASAHLSGSDDSLGKVWPLLEIVGNWQEFLSQGDFDKKAREIRRPERTGRPLGSEGFISEFEKDCVVLSDIRNQSPKAKTSHN
jgi:putative transposase